MPDYIVDPLITDVDKLQQEAFDYLTTRWPDWEPNDSNLEAWLVAACAQMVAEARDVASQVPPAIFRYFGTTILGISPVEATSATAEVTVNMLAGVVIDAGTNGLVGVPGPDGSLQAFEFTADVVSTATEGEEGAYKDVVATIRSTDQGLETSGLGGLGVEINQIDSLSYVNTITMNGATTGGQDGEPDDDYQNRLSARLTLLTPRPILPRDFELLAIDWAAQAGVRARALAVDGYNPADNTTGNERMVALFMVNADTGADLPGGLLTEIAVDLEAEREVTFVVNISNPDRFSIDVTWAGVCYPGQDPGVIETSGNSTLQSYLSAVTWGQPVTGQEVRWVNQVKVRYLELAAVLDRVEGLDYVSSLQCAVTGDPLGSVDLTLASPAPVVESGAISGTVSTP